MLLFNDENDSGVPLLVEVAADDGASISREIDLQAETIEVSAKDDSFATRHSILQHGDLKLEDSLSLYWALFPFIMVANLVIMVIIIAFSPFLSKKGLRKQKGPKTLNRLLGLVNPAITTMREGVTTSAALDVLYGSKRWLDWYWETVVSKSFWSLLRWGPGYLIVKVLVNMPGPKAVRNRLRLDYRARVDDIERQIRVCGLMEFNMLEAACGSAESAVFALKYLRTHYPEVAVKLTLVDLSGSSLRRALRLAQELGVDDCVTCLNMNLYRFFEEATGRFQQVGMTGFLDYREDGEKVINLLNLARLMVLPGGVFFCAHIAHSVLGGSWTTRWLNGWPCLVRRSLEGYTRLLCRSDWGLSGDLIWVRPESLGIHNHSICRRGQEY